MPPLSEASTFSLDPIATAFAALLVAAYLLGLRGAHRRGVQWPVRRTVAFLLLGVGSYALLSFGFVGAYASTLRWVFVIRLTGLLLVTPALLVLGRPLDLLRAADPPFRARVDALVASRAARLLGNAVVAPLIPFALFLLLLTPVAALMRLTAGGQAIVSVAVPLLGIAMAVTLLEEQTQRTSAFFTGEFLIAFVELVFDAIPGIVMRLSTIILDGGSRVAAAGAPHWFPMPLRDQQLAGDLLWFIAEAGDIPALVLLFIRWSRSDKKEATSFDDLTDEQYAALADEHLRRDHDGGR